MIAALEKAGYGVVALGAGGDASTAPSKRAPKRATLRRPVPQDTATRSTASSSRCPTSATSARIADALRLADLRRAGADPGHARHARQDDHRATAATASAARCRPATTCTQYGIPYSLTTLHTEAPDSDEFPQGSRTGSPRSAAWCAACAACASAPSARVRRRSTPSATARSCSKRSGISVEPIDLSEILGRIDAHEGRRRRRAGKARGHSASTSPPTASPTTR